MSDEPYLPARDVKVERAVGRFIIAWGALSGRSTVQSTTYYAPA